ncbi:MAG: hypothetical protein Ta2G_07300 [Termitinemataceae bacterium]|nr:MAG: hypothetical protein Ta2G_07300 [Termitinemataceae bacterium]
MGFSASTHEKFINRLEYIRKQPKRVRVVKLGEYNGLLPVEVVKNTHNRVMQRVEGLRKAAEEGEEASGEAEAEAEAVEEAEAKSIAEVLDDAILGEEPSMTEEPLEALEVLEAEEPSVNEPSIEGLTVEEPLVNEPATEEPSINEPSLEEPLVKKVPPIIKPKKIKKKAAKKNDAPYLEIVPKKERYKNSKSNKKNADNKKLKRAHRRFFAKIDRPRKLNYQTQETNTYDDTLKIKIKRPLAIKLVAIVTALLLVSLGSITMLVSWLVSADVQLSAEDNNFSVNRRTADATDSSLSNIRASVLSFLFDRTLLEETNIIAANVSTNRPNTIEGLEENRMALELKNNELTDTFFSENKNIVAIDLNNGRVICNTEFFRENDLSESMIQMWSSSSFDGETDNVIYLRNSSFNFKMPMLVMQLPVERGFPVYVFFRPENLISLYNTGQNITFAINESGDVLIHTNPEIMLGGVNLKNIPYIASMLNSSDTENIQKIYTDDQGNECFGTFRRLDSMGTSVITIIQKSIVFNGIWQTTKRNIIIGLIVLLASIFVIVIFSLSISRPLKSLIYAVQQLEAGNYNIKLESKSNDEIGVLTESFKKMGSSLANFEKFTNKFIVRIAKQGNLSRKGESKNITICFILIRDFSSMSDGLKATAIVDFVNEYLEMMVPCITNNNGSVDKFLTQGGVVIMALWGTPESSGNEKRDALNCLRASLSMRAVLCCLNKKRRERLGAHIPPIKMGSGTNTGAVIAGQIGSEDRMEYTVIGDTVNTAARIEGPNDLFDTDILISEGTYDLVKDHIIVEEQQSIKVQGKEKPLRVFAVVNFSDYIESNAALNSLENVEGIDLSLCKTCLGQEGPGSMEEVRALWSETCL